MTRFQVMFIVLTVIVFIIAFESKPFAISLLIAITIGSFMALCVDTALNRIEKNN